MIIKQLKVGFMDVFCYVLGCEETQQGLLIDPAGDEERVLKTAHTLGLDIKSIVNTHGHPDHSCGNRKIKEKTGAKLYLHADDDRLFNSSEGGAMAMQMGFTPLVIALVAFACMWKTTFLPGIHYLWRQ